MAKIRNMRELRLMKQKLQVKEELYEKELISSSAFVLDNLTDKIRDLTFDFGMRLTSEIIGRFWRRKHRKKKRDNEEEVFGNEE